jgi:AraC-like DNA-binding protein
MAPGPHSVLPSARDAVIPMHPFSGLLSVAAEQSWRVEEIFHGFEFDRSGQPLPGQRINFLQAREIVLRATYRGGESTAALSGSRKSLANLGVIGLGILAHDSLGEGLNFGVEFQRLAGSMLDMRVQPHGDEVWLVAGDLFGDDETRGFLQTDHLLTAVNALTHLRTRGFGVRRIELEGELAPELEARLVHEFGCPVSSHAEMARAVFDAGQLTARLPYHDSATAALARQVCERELRSLGLAPAPPSLLAHLFGPGGRVRSPADMAKVIGVSTRTLNRLFAAEGLKYADVAQQVQVERARRLLARGVSTEQVAIELDYSDARSFRRAFEQWTGESPASFRRRQ